MAGGAPKGGAVASGRPFEPLGGNKLFLLLLPLIVPRRPWLAITLELLMVVFSVELYFHYGIDHARDRSPYAEPWLTVSYLLIGLALVSTRENRRVITSRIDAKSSCPSTPRSANLR